jgi:hypothetical protein
MHVPEEGKTDLAGLVRVVAGRNNQKERVTGVRIGVDVIANDVYNGWIRERNTEGTLNRGDPGYVIGCRE